MPKPYKILAVVLLAALGLGGISLWRPHTPGPDAEDTPMLGALYAAPVEDVETHVLASGETLSDILSAARIQGQELADLLLGLRQYVNPRRLTDGVEVTVRRWTRTGEPRAIELRVNADSTLRLTHDAYGWTGAMSLTPVRLDTVYAAGTIEARHTLYEALVYDEQSPLPPAERIQLVYNLAEIFEYKLDFTREIQPGDSYSLVYEREARPDGTARGRRILIAEVVNQGQNYSAIYFNPDDEVEGYYDREGHPLRSGFSRYPVAYRITSTFSRRRYHPILGIYRSHLGTDFGAPYGTEVRSTADGTVIFAGRSGGYGNLVKVRHANGYETRYAHLSRFARGVHAGLRVKQKQLLGYVGQSGLATGPHLHYELRKNGTAIDVRTAHLPDAPPLQQRYLADFRMLAAERLAMLDEAGKRFLASAETPEPVVTAPDR